MYRRKRHLLLYVGNLVPVGGEFPDGHVVLLQEVHESHLFMAQEQQPTAPLLPPGSPAHPVNVLLRWCGGCGVIVVCFFVVESFRKLMKCIKKL